MPITSKRASRSCQRRSARKWRATRATRACLRPSTDSSGVPAAVQRRPRHSTTHRGHFLEAFARLSALDTSAVEPTAQVEEDRTAFRDDVAANPPASEALLANAPARDGRFFRVPKIIE